MIVLLIIILAGIFLFFVIKPPYTAVESELVEQEAATDLKVSDMAYVNRLDA
ncbi:hypothetical protein LOZ80_09675 [Paenibacillus sp. HWE-109]|uniref:hypothetical protein n=1 Tax=Paenibacillus sp. HWE-109 TaxID=1306526 RepID=UPI001EDF5CC2|nr:hypothetical protein [Paenibacillus sp. HWE-109]UKS29176.1 hypothetical protein LOZ80_09675 [Paenibacillus sp. HWE-109]